MPTGTGKTDTMIALFAAARTQRLLVIVPTDALRTQLADKFMTYGVLVAAGALCDPVVRPVVGTVEHAFGSTDEAISFAESCNVIISTVSALAASSEDVRRALIDECSHLFVDEAHHIAASQWGLIRDYFGDRYVVQFTATPFRADGNHLGGRLIFAFPLREAQRQGYFSRIDYLPVTDFDDPDRKIAVTAIERLRADLAAGFDHILMARVKTIGRADEVIQLYDKLAPDLRPVKIHSGETQPGRHKALKAVSDRTSRIIVCVDMLGEGYDLPSLKVAAIHDAHKTLPVTLQFIGRFTRVSYGKIGTASVVVSRPDPQYDENLRRLYADDADWNHIIRELAEAAISGEQAISDFEAGFGGSIPEEVSIRTLAPKMSTVVYRTNCHMWNPLGAREIFGEDQLLTSSIAVNRQKNLAWFVTEERTAVRWGNLKTVEETAYHLYVIYWNPHDRLLYINSSNTGSMHTKLASAIGGDSVEIIKGENVYRVMARVNRLVPTNVGLIDVRNRARRFTQHVGADVSEGFPTTEAQTKTQTHIFAYGYEEGQRASFGGSLKGRVWSHQVAHSLVEWADWCDHVGAKLLDDSISVDAVMRDFIRPKEVRERPNLVILGIDWPAEFYVNIGDETLIGHKGQKFSFVDAELRIIDHKAEGPIKFAVVAPAWKAEYEAVFTTDGIKYRPVGSGVQVITRRRSFPLSDVFSDIGAKLYFDDETTIEHGGFLLRPPRNTPPFRKDKLTVIDWTDVDIRKESQAASREPDSIQYHVIRRLQAERQWTVLMDDDSPGEAADIVGLAVEGDELLIRLTHCKFSSKPQPGGRIGDLYELCGQAHKSVHWKRAADLVRHLIRRERNRRSKHGRTGFEVGTDTTLRSLEDCVRYLTPRLEITIAQPGLSAAKVSDDQLQLLACTEVFLYETYAAKFQVLCSA
jgi:superfamily II DNA or RNA helicase